MHGPVLLPATLKRR